MTEGACATCQNHPARERLLAPVLMTAVLCSLLAASSARLVYTLAGLLVVLGAAMLVLTVWLVRRTRPDHEVLVRLELMGTRRWRKAGTRAREEQLRAMCEDADVGMVTEGDDGAEHATGESAAGSADAGDDQVDEDAPATTDDTPSRGTPPPVADASP